MRILIDITHPKDVHQFKHLIWEMQKKGHEFKIVARNKDCVFKLLFKYNIDFVPRSGYKGIAGKLLGVIKIDRFLYRIAKKFQPDLLIGGPGNCYIAHVALMLGKKSIIFDDTEFSTVQNWLTFPFATYVCTPNCFWYNIGRKQIRFKGYNELAYLHPNYFSPNPDVLKELGVKKNERFVIVRLVSWEANHDIGDYGFKNSVEFVKLLSKEVKVFITSEKDVPQELEQFKIRISPDKMHDVLSYATLLIGESSTMASEAAVLGTPAFFISKSKRGYTNELDEKYGLVFNYDKQEDAMKKALELLKNPRLKHDWSIKRQKMLAKNIDVTQWMIDFVESQSPEVVLVGQFDPFGSNLGGVEIYIQNLYEQLVHNKINTKIIGWSQTNNKKEDFYPVIVSKNLLGRKFSFFLLLKSAFLPIKKDSVIVVDRPDRVIPFMFRKNKVICILHGSHAKNVAIKKGAILAKIFNFIERIAFKRADGIISVSYDNKKDYEKKFSFLKNKIKVIPVGINDIFKPTDGKISSKKTVLYVGRLEKEKQVDKIINACTDINARLIIAGLGREEVYLRKIAKKHHNIIFLGKVDYDKMPELINYANVLVLFSSHEGLPTVILESLACGVPVVSSKVGDVPLIIQDGKNGYIASEADLRYKIELTLAKSSSMKKNCLKTAENYKWNNIINRILKVIG